MWYFTLYSCFLGTDEVYAVAVSSRDASLVASGGKDDRGFLWKIGSADGMMELSGTVCFIVFVINCKFQPNRSRVSKFALYHRNRADAVKYHHKRLGWQMPY